MKLWKTVESDPALSSQVAHDMDIPLPVAQVLCGLGLTRTDEINRFLHPRLSDMADPFLLPAMDVAVRRIWQALDKGETIAVYGDYDVDGITSTGLLVSILRKLGAVRVMPCLPSRISDGYGLSVDALIRCIRECRPSLVVSVDCGTNATDAVRAAAAEGIDVVVTDHHEVSGRLCDAHAIVNPKLGNREDLKILAGVGVVFKLCHALIKYGRGNGCARADKLDLRDYLDLATVGTVADVVPLLGENRILVRHGLERLNRTDSVGWQALIDVAGIHSRIDTYHVGFCIAPRLNAAGRLGSPESALELLLTDDAQRARQIARQLDVANHERREIESAIKSEAETVINTWFDPSSHFGLVVGKQGWHPGVVGLVASRLTAVFGRPVVVVAFDQDGVGRGSCRSIEGYNLLKGLDQCSDDLMTFGGHKMAAGLEIKADRFEHFRASFNDVVALELRDRDLRPVQRVDAWLNFSDVDDALLDALEPLKPFGQNNPRPVLAVRGVRVMSAPRRVGKNYLRMPLGLDEVRCPAIAFGMADRTLPEGPLDVAFYLQRDTYRGNNRLQLNIQDIRASEPLSSADSPV